MPDTVYTSEIAERICNEIAEGKSLRSVCEELDIPRRTVRGWVLDDREGFAAQYARARELQMEAFEDELNEIADDGRNDWMTIKRGGEYVEVPNNEVLQRSRLRVDTRKWIMSKILPKRYADTIKQEHSGPDGSALRVVLESPLPPIKQDA
jgi:hypothetical protein